MGIELFNSKRNTYTRCQREFFYSYVMDGTGYQKVVAEVPLGFGTLCHDSREYFYKNNGEIALDLVADKWEKERKAKIAKVAQRPFITEEYVSERRQETAEMLELYHQIMPPYLEARRSDFDQYDIVLCEDALRKPMGNGHHFNGIPDLVLRDKSTGMVWIDDFKTTAIEPAKFMGDKIFDVQQIGYIWLVQQEVGRCDGFMYDALWKKPAAKPKTTQCKSCKGKGENSKGPCEKCSQTGVGGISKQKCSSTESLFMEVLNQYPHLDPADYKEQIAGLRSIEFWKREIVSVSENQIEDWLYGTENIAEDIDHAISNEFQARDYHKNFTACCGIGRKCPFRYVCLFEETAAMDEFEPRETRYEESSDADESLDVGF